MAVGDIYKLIVVSRRFGTENIYVNGFHYRQENITIFDTPEEDLVQAWEGGSEAAYLARTSNNTRLEKYQVVPKPGGAVSYEVAAVGTGGLSGDMLPSQIAALIQWRTGAPGRSNRGRTYMPPTNEASQDGGLLITAEVNNLQTFAEGIMEIGNGITTSVWTLVVWSEKLQTYRVVTEANVVPRLATIRGRRV